MFPHYSHRTHLARFHCADRTAYAIHPLPLSEVRALRRHTPALGGQHIVLVLSSGLTLPPLTFSAGGVKAFFAALKQVHAACAGLAVPLGIPLGPWDSAVLFTCVRRAVKRAPYGSSCL